MSKNSARISLMLYLKSIDLVISDVYMIYKSG